MVSRDAVDAMFVIFEVLREVHFVDFIQCNELIHCGANGPDIGVVAKAPLAWMCPHFLKV